MPIGCILGYLLKDLINKLKLIIRLKKIRRFQNYMSLAFLSIFPELHFILEFQIFWNKITMYNVRKYIA